MIYVWKKGKIIASHSDSQKSEIQSKYPGAAFFCSDKQKKLFTQYTPTADEINAYEDLQ